MILKMLTEVRRMNKHRENFNKEIEKCKRVPHRSHKQLKNIKDQLKNTLEGFNSRLVEVEEQSSELEPKT